MGKGHDCTLKEGARPFDPPTATLEDAVAKLTESVTLWWHLIKGRQQRSRLQCDLVLCDLGVGKTRANLLEAGAYLRRHDLRRVIYIVPNLRLGREIVERFKALYPAVPVQLYLGNDQPDPDHPEFRMCRLNEEMELVMQAHGSMTTLCGSKKRGFCQHWKKCGRTRIKVLQHGLVVLAGPSTLTRAAPAGFKRGDRPPADVIIVDEPRPLDWLDATNQEVDTAVLRPFPGTEKPGTQDAAAEVMEAMRALSDLAADLPEGPVTREDILRIGRLRDWGQIRRQAFRLKAEPHDFVEPGTPSKARCDMLEQLKKHNGRVMAIARLTRVIEDAELALWTPRKFEQSGNGALFEWHDYAGLIEVRNDRSLRLRWRERIANDWRGTPILFLDATADLWILQRWFEVEPLAEIRVAEPEGVWRTQVYNKEFSYESWVPRLPEPPSDEDQSKEAGKERTRWNNAEQILHILEIISADMRGKGRDGIDVLAIVPHRLEKALHYLFEQRGGVPPGLAIEHYNDIRGVDRYGGVRFIVTVSRPMPRVDQLEEIAWTLTGIRGVCVEKLPRTDAAYAMRDGTGRIATNATSHHPDPTVRRVLVEIIDVERLQSVNRARPLRRTPDHRLEVLDLCCRPLPVLVDELQPDISMLEMAHPARRLVEAGIAPVIGARGTSEFVAAVLKKTFKAAQLTLVRDPVWRKVCQPGAGFRLFHVWVSAGQRYASQVWVKANDVAEAALRMQGVGLTPAKVEAATTAT